MRGRFTVPVRAMPQTLAKASSWRNGRCKTMLRMRSPPWPRGSRTAAEQLGKLVREQQDLLGEPRGRLSQPRCGGRKGGRQGCGNGALRNCADRSRACGEAGCAAPSLPRLRGAGQSEAACARERASTARQKGCAGAVSRSPRYGRVPEETIVFALTKKQARWTSIRPGHQRLAGACDGLALRSRPHASGRAGKTKSREGHKNRFDASSRS